MKTHWPKRFFILLLVFILGLFVLYRFHRPLLIAFGNYLFVKSELQPSDLIVVISGSLPEVHYGIDLYKAGYAKKLLFVGDFPAELAVISQEPFLVIEKPWEEVAGQLANHAGVPSAALLFSHTFTSSTYERVASFLTIARQQNLHSIIVVSDHIHSRRIAESAQKIIGDDPYRVLSAPTPLDYIPTGYRFHPDSWWTNEQDLKDVVDEWIKLGFYWLKY